MKIDIKELLEKSGAFLEIDYSYPMVDINPDILDGSIRFTGKLVNNDGILELEGNIKAQYEAQCGRCLGSLQGELETEVRESIFKLGQEPDKDSYAFEDNMLDIGTIVRDNVILNIPMRFICSDSCRGLCPVCGKDLNIGQCSCSTDMISEPDEKSKFDVLKKLL
jgi:uncharacterized protein